MNNETTPATDEQRLSARWRQNAIELREEANRIRRTIKEPTDAEARCNIRAEILDKCGDELDVVCISTSPPAEPTASDKKIINISKIMANHNPTRAEITDCEVLPSANENGSEFKVIYFSNQNELTIRNCTISGKGSDSLLPEVHWLIEAATVMLNRVETYAPRIIGTEAIYKLKSALDEFPQQPPQPAAEENFDGYWNQPSQSPECWLIKNGRVFYVYNDGSTSERQSYEYFIQKVRDGEFVRNTWPIPQPQQGEGNKT